MAPEVSIAKVRKNLADVLNRAHYRGDRVQITKHDKPYAIIASPEDGEVLEAIDKMLEQSGLATREQLLAELAKLTVAEKRGEMESA